MSREDVEIVRRIYERLNRGDVEGVIELCDADFLIGAFSTQIHTAGMMGFDGFMPE